MNEQLENFARNELKVGLNQLPESWQLTFKRMYAHKNLTMPIDEVVDKMGVEKLDWAMEQVRRSLEKFPCTPVRLEKFPRTLLRVVDVDRDAGHFHVIVPGWSVREKIRLFLADLPSKLQTLVAEDKRFHAKANVGCEDKKDLFFFDWEAN